MVWELANSSWGIEELQSAITVLGSGKLTLGDSVWEMERNFADWNGAKYSVMVNSGSSANLLMVAALFFTSNDDLKLQAGDEVIVPAVSWSTTYFPLQQYGLKVKFVDVGLDTFNIDVEQLEKAITNRTRAIFAVNLLGNPCSYKKIVEIAKKNKLVLLEDNCESLGCELDDKKGGIFGIMGSHSSYFSHHFSTIEGGYITTDDEELYHILLCLRSHGWTRHLPEKNHICSKNPRDSFHESFRFILPGYNLRPTELQAAIGLQQIEKLDSFIFQRRQNAELFVSEFSELGCFNLQKEIGKSSWFGFGLTLKQDCSFARAELFNLLEKSSVEYRPIVAGNFTKNDVIKFFDYEIFGKLQNSDIIADRGLFLGNHHYDISDKIIYLKNKIKEII